jgi:hypothetical protein
VPEFTTFLVRSLELLRRQAPAGYTLVCQRLGSRTVAIEVEGERLCVRNVNGLLDVKWGARGAVAQARASKATLVELLRGELRLTQAIVEDRVQLVGALDDLVAFYDGLLAYFMSAVRAPGFAALLGEFLGTWHRSPRFPTHPTVGGQ